MIPPPDPVAELRRLMAATKEAEAGEHRHYHEAWFRMACEAAEALPALLAVVEAAREVVEQDERGIKAFAFGKIKALAVALAALAPKEPHNDHG